MRFVKSRPVRSLKLNMDSIKKVIDYLWLDEAKDYDINSYNFIEKLDNHIFQDLIKAKIWLYEQEERFNGHAPDIAEAMYADSPFNLGTNEDDRYRDLVDWAIGL